MSNLCASECAWGTNDANIFQTRTVCGIVVFVVVICRPTPASREIDGDCKHVRQDANDENSGMGGAAAAKMGAAAMEEPEHVVPNITCGGRGVRSQAF